MAKSGRSKSSSYPNGKRRKDEEGNRLAPRAVRRETGKRLMSECTEKEVQRISGIPKEKQSEASSGW